MKHVIFILLFGLFLLGPPDSVYADSNDVTIEMVTDDVQQSVVFDYTFEMISVSEPVLIVNPLGISGGKISFERMIPESLLKTNKKGMGKATIENKYLKIAGTDRMCIFILYSNFYTKNSICYTFNSDIRIRGSDNKIAG